MVAMGAFCGASWSASNKVYHEDFSSTVVRDAVEAGTTTIIVIWSSGWSCWHLVRSFMCTH